MSYTARTILTPGASRKRKERESFYASAAAQATAAAATKPAAKPAQAQAQAAAKEGPAEPVMSDNRLLAGYMAHEFLTRGTLLEARPEAAREEPPKPPGGKPSGSYYGEVASILKADGVHLPGVLNPTHLARWVQM